VGLARALASGTSQEQYYKNIKDYVAKTANPLDALNAASENGVSREDINRALGTKAATDYFTIDYNTETAPSTNVATGFTSKVAQAFNAPGGLGQSELDARIKKIGEQYAANTPEHAQILRDLFIKEGGSIADLQRVGFDPSRLLGTVAKKVEDPVKPVIPTPYPQTQTTYTAPTVYQPLPEPPPIYGVGQPALDVAFRNSPARTYDPRYGYMYTPAARLLPATGAGMSFTPPSVTSRPRSLLNVDMPIDTGKPYKDLTPAEKANLRLSASQYFAREESIKPRAAASPGRFLGEAAPTKPAVDYTTNPNAIEPIEFRDYALAAKGGLIKKSEGSAQEELTRFANGGSVATDRKPLAKTDPLYIQTDAAAPRNPDAAARTIPMSNAELLAQIDRSTATTPNAVTPERDRVTTESRSMLENLTAGLVQIPQTVMYYGSNVMQSEDPLARVGADVSALGSSMVEGAKQDPVGFTLDMLPLIGEYRSGRDAVKFSDLANEARAAGDLDTAMMYEQIATLAAAGAVPLGGIGARGAKRAAMRNIVDVPSGNASAMLDELTTIQNNSAGESFKRMIAADTEGAINAYTQLESTKGGKLIDTDLFRELSPEYRDNRTLASNVHEPASELSKLYFTRLLEKTQGQEGTWLFTGGGPASGKSSAVSSAMEDAAQGVVDGTMSNPQKVVRNVNQVLEDPTKNATIFYIDRDPVKAFDLALNRSMDMENALGSGRTIPVKDFLDMHQASRQSIPKIYEQLKDNPRVDFEIWSNNAGVGEQFPTTIDRISTFNYNDSLERILNRLDEAYANGEISETVYRGYKSGAESRTPQGASGTNAQIDSRINKELGKEPLGQSAVDARPDIPPLENSQRTQLGSSTIPSYEKAKELLSNKRILDFGAGRGQGASKIGADTFEPYPREGFVPTYSNVADIPDGSYDGVTSLNVLNVMPREVRDNAVRNIGRVLMQDGEAVITTRGRDVMTANGIDGPEPMSRITTTDTYQKGFTQPELVKYVSSILGDGFTVSNLPQKIGAAGVLVKKMPQTPRSKAADDLAALTAQAPTALKDAPRINEEESIGLRAAQNTLARNQQDIIDSAIETVREEGINVESLISDPKYWDAENEQFTDRGFIEYNRLIETEGKRRANIRAVESLADLNDASHDAQADAFYAIAELRGLNPSVDYSFGGSRYITLQDGTKFRFANHGNTVRDTSMQPDVNVAPDYSTFTDALERLPSATAIRAERGATAPKAADDLAALTAKAPLGVSQEVRMTGRQVSERVPTSVKFEGDSTNPNLTIGVDVIRQTPDTMRKQADVIAQYPNYPLSAATDPESVFRTMEDQITENLLFLHDKMPADVRQGSMQWYDGANRIASVSATKYGLPIEATAGVYAALSPQMDWYKNVSLGDRVLDIMSTKTDISFTPGMKRKATQLIESPTGGFNAQTAKVVKTLLGKRLSDLDNPVEKAIWLRLYDESHNPREYNIVNPTGDIVGLSKTAKGENAKVGWGSLREIAKAISIFENPAIENISRQLGGQHKVRSFYNNIADPNKGRSVTSDTHNVAAGLLRPLSGTSTEVMDNLGAASSSSLTGAQGTYGLYADAVRNAADERGVQPRQMQSITWEGVRGLYSPALKRNKNAQAQVAQVFNEYKKGKINANQMRNFVFEIGGGMDVPTWYGK
jgi:hypothetical protein